MAQPTWSVVYADVQWETDGSRNAKGQLVVAGPYCPSPCLAPLSYGDALDRYEDDVDAQVLGGQLAGYLYCSDCGKNFGDLGARQSPDGEFAVALLRAAA